MGIQTMGSQSSGQHQPPHLQPAPPPLARQGSWYNLTLGEVESQLGQLGKPLGSMDLDELLRNVWSAEAASLSVSASQPSPSASLQRQASLTLARALTGKTVDEVWKEILWGQRKRFGEGVIGKEEEQLLGEVTLEDFLVKAGLFADATIGPGMAVDAAVEAVALQSYQPQQQLGVSSISSPSVGALSDATTSSGRKRDGPDAYETNMERRLRRKIKNRESAARSRARKQAYHNELVTKVTRLEEEILKLKKEKEIDEKLLPLETLPEPRYQLRRTSSASF